MANDKPEKYKIAEIQPRQKKGREQAFTLKKNFHDYSSRQQVKAEVKIENHNRVIVYAEIPVLNLSENPVLNLLEDPVLNLLGNFERWQNSKHNIPVKVILCEDEKTQEADEYKKLKQEHEALKTDRTSLQGKIKELESEKTSLESRLTQTKEEKSNLEDQYSQQVKRLESEVLQETASLETLAQNEDKYILTQEVVWEKIFLQISKQIEGRKVYEKIEELKKARKLIKERETYRAEQGVENILDKIGFMPEDLKEQLIKRWENAERTIKEAEEYQKSMIPLEIPGRIARTEDGAGVVLPVDLKSIEGASRVVYEILVNYGGIMHTEFGLIPRIDEDQAFATLRLKGDDVDFKALEEKLVQTFEEEYSRTMIRVKPMPTSYFASVFKGEETPEKGNLPTLGEYLTKIIEERYGNRKNFIREKHLLEPDVYQITAGTFGRCPSDYILKRTFADPLGIDLSYLVKLSKNQTW